MSEADQVEIVPRAMEPGMGWQPAVGAETYDLMQRVDLPQEARQRVIREAVSILGRCVPPESPGGTTGLVLGQVQSGKTMSFTTVTALARDNGYRLVIVITGTTIPLLEQSVARLRRDLGIDEANRNWKHISIVPERGINAAAIRDALAEWRDAAVPAHERKTVLVTVMKQHLNLRRLVQVLGTLDLGGVPALVIDDEGDQASLNTKVRTQEQSTTYLRLLDLRSKLPHHTFLQYTATPQALLLCNIIDILSPDFADVLEPGDGYCGGQAFFLESRDLVHEIPAADLPVRDQPMEEPPASLFEAMRIFFLGVAAGMLREGGRGNRSMLVHPSVKRAQHAQFHDWISRSRDEWMAVLDRPADDADRQEFVGEFRRAEAQLRRTVPDLPPFSELLRLLPLAIRRTQVELINAARGRTPSINWNDSYSFILVGGTAMDRGFTVRGLTVSYISRGLGGGNADTVQQRGRFFGYKRQYLGYCRVYLPGDVLDAFREYVTHEEDVRTQLREHRNEGRSLSEWRRAFLLDSAMRPTRDNVIDIAYSRVPVGRQWLAARAPHDSPQVAARNMAAIEAFRRSVTLEAWPGDERRTEQQRPLVSPEIPLSQVHAHLLAELRFPRMEDTETYVSALVVIKRICERIPDAVARVFFMGSWQRRKRTPDDAGRIEPYQGAHPVSPLKERGSIYPGDKEIRSADAVTVQIHRLSVGGVEDAPTVAIWIPGHFAEDVVFQPQGGP